VPKWETLNYSDGWYYPKRLARRGEDGRMAVE